MTREQLLEAVLNSLKDPVVVAGTDHTIVYMNDAAADHYSEGRALVGRSLLDCHNEQSCEVIGEVLARLVNGEDECLISENEERRIHMRAVRDADGRLLGYYERYSFSA